MATKKEIELLKALKPITVETQEEIWERLTADAEAAGLDLNYAPETVEGWEDISLHATEEWVEERKHGIGGSDAGVVMGVNHYKSLTHLAMEKLGTMTAEPVDADKQFIFDYGHVMEDALGNYFARVTGFDVFKDNAMYQHPYYPWMRADCDSFCYDNEGLKCGLEFKTSMTDNAKQWKSGIFGQGALLPNPSYVYQIRHYMAVMNLSRWYLVIGFDNQAQRIQIIRIDRDINEEIRLINAEYEFWNNYVVTGTVPEFEYVSDSDFKDIKNSIVPEISSEKMEKLEFGAAWEDKVMEFLDLQEEVAELKAKYEKRKAELEEMKLPFIEELAGNPEGFFPLDEDAEVRVTYKSSERKGVDTDKLQYVYPEVYEDVKKVTETKTFKFQKHSFSKAEKAAKGK